MTHGTLLPRCTQSIAFVAALLGLPTTLVNGQGGVEAPLVEAVASVTGAEDRGPILVGRGGVWGGLLAECVYVWRASVLVWVRGR